MRGANPPKPPSSSSSSSVHRKSRWDPSSSTAAAAGDHKPTTDPKSKPPQQNQTKDKPPTPKPRTRPDNPNYPAFPSRDEPPPPPSYGFHMLDRRTLVLADGSVRSYFALPTDYQNFTLMPRLPELRARVDFGFDRGQPFPMSPDLYPRFDNPFARAWNQEHWNSLGPMKRRFGEDEREVRDGFERQRQQLLQYGNASPNGLGQSGMYSLVRGEETRPAKQIRTDQGKVGRGARHSEVDQVKLKKAFLNFVKLVYENTNQKKSYLTDGKQGHLQCLACRRSSKDFPDMHSLIMHSYNADTAELLVDHLGFHKALCILMGWNFMMPPDNSKTYQMLSADEAAANQDDLIIWPPTVLIQNSITGKGRDGRMEGIGNRAMDSILRDIGFGSGKSMSMYSREGHLGIHVVKFSGDESGLKEATRMADYFERKNRGRKDWARVQSLKFGVDEENNPNLVQLDPKTGEKQRILYGHLATAADLEKVTFEVKKKVTIESRREYKPSI